MDTHVLVVDDDLEINELLGEYLELEGIVYHKALNGRAGIESAQQIHPDAIILDCMLPDIDGYEVARQLSSHQLTNNIPIIMLTCMCQQDDFVKGMAAGAFRYMNKPFLPDDLLNVLREALEWKRRLPDRPAGGHVEFSADNAVETLKGVNQMVSDIFARTHLGDAYVANIRDAFVNLQQWADDWGKKHHRNPRLQMDYRFIGGNAATTPGDPTDIEWILSEPEPGLLADTLFKPASALGSGGDSFGSPWNNGNPAPLINGTPAAATSINTCQTWYHFVAKTGAIRFEKDPRTSSIRLVRHLPNGEPVQQAVPIVIMNGNRVPTRVREEAVKKRG